MLLWILLAVALVVAALAVVIALRPAEFSVARSATIAAPPAAVFAEVDDFRRWAAWSPFEKTDPAMSKEFSGPPAGTGASYAWSGNRQAGEGRATIVESRPGELVRIRLDFVRPFAGTNMAAFSFVPAPGGTTVTWSLSGRGGFLFKAMGLVMDCEKMCGAQFEQGLAALRAAVERQTAPAVAAA
jgi:uncharacterized protein YndB with AHSA1/START domain